LKGRVRMKNFLALFLICFCLSALFIACEVQSQESGFVEKERQTWESQNHFVCDRLFGFAWGWGKWSGRIFSKSEVFDWIATSNQDGFITIRTSKRLPKRIVKQLSKLDRYFEFSLSGNHVTIKILNNDWVEAHCRPKIALQEELQIICEKTGLEMTSIRHDSLR
jgi:hypothetical protein